MVHGVRLFVASAAVFALTACAGPVVNEEAAEGSAEVAEGDLSDLDAVGEIQVDEGLLTVDITIPADLLEGVTDEDLQAGVQEEGFIGWSRNPDGSVTYTMTKATQEQYLAKAREEIAAGFDQVIADEPGVYKSIEFNDALDEFTVTVDQAAFEDSFSAGFLSLGIALQGGFYQVFAGVEPDGQKVVIRYIDQASGENFLTQNWPEDFE